MKLELKQQQEIIHRYHILGQRIPFISQQMVVTGQAIRHVLQEHMVIYSDTPSGKQARHEARIENFRDNLAAKKAKLEYLDWLSPEQRKKVMRQRRGVL
jgi:hypothetical protein